MLIIHPEYTGIGNKQSHIYHPLPMTVNKIQPKGVKHHG